MCCDVFSVHSVYSYRHDIKGAYHCQSTGVATGGPEGPWKLDPNPVIHFHHGHQNMRAMLAASSFCADTMQRQQGYERRCKMWKSGWFRVVIGSLKVIANVTIR